MHSRSIRNLGTLASLAILSVSTVALAQGRSSGPPLTNWSAAPTYTPARHSGMHTMGDTAGPVPYIPITPCRRYDTRTAGSGGALGQGVNRTVTLTGGGPGSLADCGIPAGAVAVSVNITVFNIIGATGNGTFKVDTVSPPTVSWVNYPSTETQRANAGTVALNGSGAIVVQVAQGAGQVDFIVDTNGYYSTTPANAQNFFQIINNSGSWSIETTNSSASCGGACGVFATVAGGDALYGSSNTGVGVVGTSSSGDGLDAFTGSGTSGIVGQTGNTAVFAAGVRGISGSGVPTGASGCCGDLGVLGESATGIAVAGVAGPGGRGAFFDLKDSGGSAIALASLAFKVGANNYAFYASTGDYGGTGAKYFVEPHPTDATQVIHYISLEGGESGTYTRGTAVAASGTTIIQLPEHFSLVTDPEGLTVQLTPVGAAATMYVESADLSQIVVHSNRSVTFHYMVNGIRRGYTAFQPVADGLEFVPDGPDSRMPAGLSAELKGRLVANGTYNSDGTVNTKTAERLGWTKVWQDRADQVARASAAHKAEMAKIQPQGNTGAQ